MNKVVLVALFCFLSGCSSIKVHSDDAMTARPYAGTKMAYGNAKRAWHDYEYVGHFEHNAIDVVGSAVLDTFTLPYDLFQEDEVASE